MRKWVDLGVNSSDEEVIKAALDLGYAAIGSPELTSDSIDVVNRVDLHPRTQNDLGKQLRRIRSKTEIIVVHCNNKSVSRLAAHDNRIDYLRFPISGDRKLQRLDHRQVGLMKDTGIGLEVCVGELLVDDRYELVKRIGVIRRSLDLALKKDIPVAASSGAEDKYGLRNPHGMAGLLSILGVEEELAMDMISTTPIKRVQENRAKLSDSFVEPGVWIVDP